MDNQVLQPRGHGRRYMMAMVLGTALSAMSASSATAAEISESTVNDISRYCTACWRNARLPMERWSDCTQEVLQRLLGTIPAAGWTRVLAGDSAERLEFLRAIDAVKKRSQRDGKRSRPLIGPVPDPRDVNERSHQDDRAAVAQAAEDLLSPRQQQILQMSFEGWSVHDLARELQLPAERVSDEKYKAIRKLREHFCRENVS